MFRSIAVGVLILSISTGDGLAWGQDAKAGTKTKGTPKANVQEPAKQTKFPGGKLDSWYKILQGEKHVGHSHFLIREIESDQNRYEMESELDLEIRLGKDQFEQVQSQVLAKLDARFEPTEIKGRMASKGFSIDYQAWTDGEMRKLQVMLPGQRPVIIPAGASDESSHDNLYMTFLHLHEAGKLEKQGTRLRVKLLDFHEFQGDMQEGLKPKPNEVTLTVLGKVNRKYLGKESSVTQVSVGNYPAKFPEVAWKTAFIDGFGRVVEMHTLSDVEMILVESDKKALPEKTNVRPGNRRDPFRKDLAMTAPGTGPGGDTGPGARAESVIAAGEEKKKLDEAMSIVDDMKKARDEGLQGDDLAHFYTSFIDIYKPLRQRFIDLRSTDRLQQLDDLKVKVEEYYPGAQKVYDEAHSIFTKIGTLALQEKCEEMEKHLGELMKYPSRPELMNSEQLKNLERDLIPKARDLVARCKIRQELRAKTLVLTGTIEYDKQIHTPVQVEIDVLGHRLRVERNAILVHRMVFAIINGKEHKVGQIVKGQNVSVEEISRGSVRVSYKKETRDISVKQ